MRRRVLGTMGCAAALAVGLPVGGVAHAAEVCEERTVPGGSLVKVCVRSPENVEVYVSVVRAGAYFDVAVERYYDPETGLNTNRVRVCTSELTPECVTLP